MGRYAMMTQVFNVEDYWKVIVFYDLDYDFLDSISIVLKRAGATEETAKSITDNLYIGKAKAVTYSNLKKRLSIILFNRHRDKEDYMNSIIHEAEHVKQAMLEAYSVEDAGEPPAYTIGYLVSCMYRVFKKLILNCES